MQNYKKYFIYAKKIVIFYKILVYIKKKQYLCARFGPFILNYMKNSILNSVLIGVLLSVSILCMGQKKVAVLEPVAGEGNVTSMEKAIVRGEIRKAIFRIDGFEAINRSEWDQVFNELNFQISGNVPKDQIHRLGEMSGADYLCISTINKSESQFYIEAYLVDVTTGNIDSPASQFGEMKDGNMSDMYRICQELIKELIGDKVVTGNDVIEEDFDGKQDWGWTIFSHDAKSVMVANDELRITNFSNLGTAQSDVMAPVDIRRNFKMTFNFVIQEAKMFSAVGVKFGGNNSITVNSGSCAYKIGSANKTSTIGMGLGRNKPVVIDVIKNGNRIALHVNGVEVGNEEGAFNTNQISVFAGVNTLAMLKKVTIRYTR